MRATLRSTTADPCPPRRHNRPDLARKPARCQQADTLRVKYVTTAIRQDGTILAVRLPSVPSWCSFAAHARACGQHATPDRNTGGVTTLRFFEHDTQQASLDLGPQETGPGDQFFLLRWPGRSRGRKESRAHLRPVRHVQWKCPPPLAMSCAPVPSSSIADRSQPKAWLTVPPSSVGEKLSHGRSWVAQKSIVMPAAMVLSKCRSTCRIIRRQLRS